MLEAFQGAIDELAWRFQRGDSALGIRGQSYDDVRSGGVWDAAASERVHWAKRDEPYRHAVQKVAKVDRTLSALGPETRQALRLAFEPFGRSSSRLHVAFTESNVFLLGVVIDTQAAQLAFAKAHSTMLRPPNHVMLRWLESEVAKSGSGALFDRLRRAAWDYLTPPLTAYEAARQERIAVEREDRSEDGARRAAELERVLDEQQERERLKLEDRHMRALRDLEAARAVQAVQPVGEAG